MTYEKPEQPPPFTPRRTAASGVPRAASFFLANSTALSEMVISRRDFGASEGAAGCASGAAEVVSMGRLWEIGHGHVYEGKRLERGGWFGDRGIRVERGTGGALGFVVFDRALDRVFGEH